MRITITQELEVRNNGANVLYPNYFPTSTAGQITELSESNDDDHPSFVAVQASPVLVLSDSNSTIVRNKLRQKALVENVQESKV